jgi:hypothetical protein
MKAFVHKLEAQPVKVAKSTLSPPVITYLTEKKLWRLEQDYSYRDGDYAITVPSGFEFDLASVPRFIWWLIGPFDLSIAAPLVHDFLYRFRGAPPQGCIDPRRTYTRSQADLLFRTIMKEEGVWWWRRAAAYRAVRWFGGAAW